MQLHSMASRKRVRTPIWTLRDSTLLVEMYGKYHDVIVGVFVAAPIQKSRQATWQALYEEFNSSAPDNPRGVVHIQTKISNIKDEARRYAKAVRLQETDGETISPEPPDYVKKMFEIVQGHSSSESFASNGTLSLEQQPTIEHTMSVSPSNMCIEPEASQPKRRTLSDVTSPPYEGTEFSTFMADNLKLSPAGPQLDLQADDPQTLAMEQRKLIKEKRYLVYLKTVKACSELSSRGIPFESFEAFSQHDGNDNFNNLHVHKHEFR